MQNGLPSLKTSYITNYILSKYSQKNIILHKRLSSCTWVTTFNNSKNIKIVTCITKVEFICCTIFSKICHTNFTCIIFELFRFYCYIKLYISCIEMQDRNIIKPSLVIKCITNSWYFTHLL